MSRNWSENKLSWLVVGLGLGLVLASVWPHESPAYAETAVASDKFALCTCQTNVGAAEAIFVLDSTTGRLIGGTYNPQTNSFSQPMIRNLAQDFGLTEAGNYMMVSGYVGARSRGAQPAAGGVYVAELNSGKLVLYGFMNVQGNNIPQQLTPLGMFPWRAAQ